MNQAVGFRHPSLFRRAPAPLVAGDEAAARPVLAQDAGDWRVVRPRLRVAHSMSPDIRPGALVTVVPPRELLRQGRRHVHFGSGLDLDGAVGIVDRIDRRYGEHRYVVVFSTVPKPMFGEPWVDCFRASELVPVDE